MQVLCGNYQPSRLYEEFYMKNPPTLSRTRSGKVFKDLRGIDLSRVPDGLTLEESKAYWKRQTQHSTPRPLTPTMFTDTSTPKASELVKRNVSPEVETVNTAPPSPVTKPPDTEDKKERVSREDLSFDLPELDDDLEHVVAHTVDDCTEALASSFERHGCASLARFCRSRWWKRLLIVIATVALAAFLAWFTASQSQ